MKMKINSQLEFSHLNGHGCLSLERPQRRPQRAAFWFARMRQVVERAIDWRPAPPPRPEQVWFPGANACAEEAPVKTHTSREHQLSA